MVMLLPKDIPTLESMATKNWTRPDNVFGSANLEDKVTFCTTDPQLRGPGTDHVPILTVLELPANRTTTPPSYNFCLTNWGAFRDELQARLVDIPHPTPLSSTDALQNAVHNLMGVLQDVVCTTVPLVQPSPYSKRWWNRQLAQLKKKKNKLNELSYRFKALPAHLSHEELWRAGSEYSKAILEAKQEHWVGFLEGLSYREVWIAN